MARKQKLGEPFNPALLPKAYPWYEHVSCRRCGRQYGADYRQERDWSLCPDCTGEAGRPCRNAEQFRAARSAQQGEG